jgi:hypothetical protein
VDLPVDQTKKITPSPTRAADVLRRLASKTARGQRTTRGKHCGRRINSRGMRSLWLRNPAPLIKWGTHLRGAAPWTRTAGRASGFDSARGLARICSSTSHCRLRVTRTVVDVRNHGHVANLLGPVHDGAQLRYCEIHLRRKPAKVKPGDLTTACACVCAAHACWICPLTILPVLESHRKKATRADAKNPLFLESGLV